MALVQWDKNGTIKSETIHQFGCAPIDKKSNYVKRCIAIAGDTLQIKDGIVYINGQKKKAGNIGDIPSLDKRLALGNLPSTVNHLLRNTIRDISNIPGVKPALEVADVVRKNPVVSTVSTLPILSAFDVADAIVVARAGAAERVVNV